MRLFDLLKRIRSSFNSQLLVNTMQPFILYLIQLNFALVLFYLLYIILFKRDTFLQLRRFYFISGIVFSLLYPLLVVPGLSDVFNIMKYEPNVVETKVFFEAPTMQMIIEQPEEAVNSFSVPWGQIVTVLYFAITVFFISRFMWQLILIFRMRVKGQKTSVSGVKVYNLKTDITPFSFFGMIFINTEMHTEEELNQIVIHEHTHVKEKHSLDIMLIEVLLLFSLWSPFVWIFKREMAMNLEYLADKGVLREGVDSREYQYHLLRLTYHETAVQIVNNFNVSQLKQRIMMMNKTRSSTLKLAKYLLMLPMFFVLIAANSAYAGVNDQTYQAPPPPPPPPVKIAETNEIFVVVEDMPEYPGGVDAMMRFLGETIRYPFEAMTNGIQGRVICNFVIEKDGSVSDVQIVRGIDPHLDDEAIRVIEAMPKWKPGMQKKEIVRTRFTLPIVFRLTGDVDDNQKTSDNSSVPTEDIFVVVEQQPEYPDGVEAMMKFLVDSVRYPIEAQEKGIQGRVIVNFVVNKDGSITDVNVVRGVDPSIDAEAVRVIESMPKWKPGKQRGKEVNVRYTLPVSFKLDNEPLSEQQKQELQKIKDSMVESKFPGGNDAYMKYLAN